MLIENKKLNLTPAYESGLTTVTKSIEKREIFFLNKRTEE